MKPDHAFAAARALANHDPALLASGPGEAECLAALAGAGTRLARTLGDAMARLCGGDAPEISVARPIAATIGMLRSESPAVYSRYALPGGAHAMLGAIDAGAVMRLVDRAFGGPGEAPRTMPRDLPPSADLIVQRIEAIVAEQFTRALGTGVDAVRAQRRDADWGQIGAAGADTPAAIVMITLTEGTRTPWPIRLAVPIAAIPALTGLAAPARNAAPATARDPAEAPFAAMPLILTALLVDTTVPLHRVSRLEPGQVLALPIARQVPIVTGTGAAQRVIASGTIGAVDDRVAIQINPSSRPAGPGPFDQQ